MTKFQCRTLAHEHHRDEICSRWLADHQRGGDHSRRSGRRAARREALRLTTEKLGSTAAAIVDDW